MDAWQLALFGKSYRRVGFLPIARDPRFDAFWIVRQWTFPALRSAFPRAILRPCQKAPQGTRCGLMTRVRGRIIIYRHDAALIRADPHQFEEIPKGWFGTTFKALS